MNKEIYRQAAELILELSELTPEDYMQVKMTMLAVTRCQQAREFLSMVFILTERNRPLLIEAR